MQRSVIIGLDIGTSNVKAAAYLENGERLAEASIPYPTYYPQPGWAEQNPLDWRRSIKEALAQLAGSLGGRVEEVAALGLSAHAPGLVPVDSRGSSLLERVPIWMDERSLEQGEALLAEVGPEWVGLGMPFASFAAKLRWFTEARPDLAEEAASALGVKAYLVHWLTGRYATDPSSEPGRSEISEQVCTACGWSPDRLAPVLPAGEIVGRSHSPRGDARQPPRMELRVRLQTLRHGRVDVAGQDRVDLDVVRRPPCR
jgi:sugar (pentulose or hexulose) kinase